MMLFTVQALGCKVNQYDAQAVAAELRRAGLADAPAGRVPDLVVVSTCCVTRAAMRKSRQAVRRAVRSAPSAAVLVTGCYGDYDPRAVRSALAEAAGAPHACAVAGYHGDLATSVRRFAERLRRGAAAAPPAPARGSPGDIATRRLAAVKAAAPGAAALPPIDSFANHQRAFVKVQDGCDAFCSYCVVPYTRPVVRWRPLETVLPECRRLVAAGHREIVLCGVFLGAYGQPTAVRRRWRRRGRLVELLRGVAGIDGLWRVRLSSLEPLDVDDELLAALRDLPAAAPHLHLPLQSGSDRVLRRMNRQYGAGDYLRTVERLRRALDRPAVTADVIVGFPGEGEADFRATLDAARRAGLARIHAFPFSAMEGTAAWRWRAEGPPPQVVRRRMAELAAVARDLGAAFRRQFVGETMEALVERGRGQSGLRRAMTDRYLTVTFAAPPRRRLTGQIVRLRIDAAGAEGLSGELAKARQDVRR